MIFYFNMVVQPKAFEEAQQLFSIHISLCIGMIVKII